MFYPTLFGCVCVCMWEFLSVCVRFARVYASEWAMGLYVVEYNGARSQEAKHRQHSSSTSLE